MSDFEGISRRISFIEINQEFYSEDTHFKRHFTTIFSKIYHKIDKIEFKQTILGQVFIDILSDNILNLFIYHEDQNSHRDKLALDLIFKIQEESKTEKEKNNLTDFEDSKIEKYKTKIFETRSQVSKLVNLFDKISEKLVIYFGLNQMQEIFTEMIVRLLKNKFQVKFEKIKKNNEKVLGILNEFEFLEEKNKIKSRKKKNFCIRMNEN